MPLQATSGAASYDAFGGGVPVVTNYIEDVFSTYVYTGNSSTQTITNGIDLSTKGGLIWFKSRSGTYGTQSHVLTSNELTNWTKYLSSNTTGDTAGLGATAFTPSTTGFALNSVFAGINDSGTNYASWTFRKQPKFFDVVTYTGNGVAGRAISHNLGSTPGFIVVKCTSSAAQWICWHRAYNSGNGYGYLNDTTSWFNTGADVWGNGTTYTAPTSTTFTVNGDTVGNLTNGTGDTYVAYLFAHNAGGFGLTGTDNVISCGSFTSSAGGLATVNLGYEPQWLMFKGSNGVTNWQMVDNMRGFVVGAANTGTSYLNANSSAAEGTNPPVGITNTGFNFDGAPNITYIYIAIRRGPMKVPTDATKVFSPVARTGTGANATVTAGFTPDVLWYSGRNAYYNRGPVDKLRGVTNYMYFTSTGAEQTFTTEVTALTNTGMTVGDSSGSTDINKSGIPYINWFLQRAPSFFDEVCYTGNSTNPTAYNHNLTVIPELLIIKRRTGLSSWPVFYNFVGSTFDKLQGLNQDGVASTGQSYSGGAGLGGAPTTTTFTLDSTSTINGSGHNFVAYLFATCAGVSKVGSYTGNGSTQTIDCGFGAGGARFVLIKRTDATGNWYTYDTARGMTTLTDPYLFLNDTNADTATLGSVTTVSTGFALNSAILAAINVNGGSYIFLAIA